MNLAHILQEGKQRDNTVQQQQPRYSDERMTESTNYRNEQPTHSASPPTSSSTAYNHGYNNTGFNYPRQSYPQQAQQSYDDRQRMDNSSYYNKYENSMYSHSNPRYPQQREYESQPQQYYEGHNTNVPYSTSYWQHERQPYYQEQTSWNGYGSYNNSNYNSSYQPQQSYHRNPSVRSSSKQYKEDDLDSLLSCATRSQFTGSVVIHKRKLNTTSSQIKMQNEESTRTRTAVKSESTLVLTSSNLHQDAELLYRKYNENNKSPYNNIIIVKPLLILDINGILCYRVKSRAVGEDGNTVKYRPSIGHIACTDIIPRSDLHDFLYFLCNHFTLAIWTSAKLKNANSMLDLLIPPNIRQTLLFTWGQDMCEFKRTKQDEKGFVFMKLLCKVWKEYPLWNASNTILMDDSREKISEDHTSNVIHPPPLLGTMKVVGDGIVDMDEENQMKQFEFFNQFVQFWYHRTVCSTSSVTTVIITTSTRIDDNFNGINEKNTIEDNKNGKDEVEESNEAKSMDWYLEKHATGHMGWDNKNRSDRLEGTIKRTSSNESLEDKFKHNSLIENDQINLNNDDNEIDLDSDENAEKRSPLPSGTSK